MGITHGSERQIAANQHNARNCIGPRSAAGKQRPSANAYRHGLAASAPSHAQFAQQVDHLAREIAGNTKSSIARAQARSIAEAALDLAHARNIKVALIESVAFGGSRSGGKGLAAP